MIKINTSRSHRIRIGPLVWPLMLANITVPLLGLVDAAVLGHLDDAAYLGGVALAGQLFTTVLWLFGFLRMGTSGLSARVHGQGDDRQAALLLIRSLLVALMIALLLGLTQRLWIPVGLSLLQAKGDVATEARLYADIRVWSLPFALMQYAAVGWLVGRQQMRTVMMVAIVANTVNLVLDLLLVVGLGWATAGVAWASVAAEITGLVLALQAIMRRMPPYAELQLSWSVLLEPRSVKALLAVNQHLFVRTALLLFTFSFFNAQSARLGEVTLAANALLMTGLLVISNALDGFAHAAEALIGEAAGQKNDASIVDAARATLRGALWVAAGLSTLFFIFGDYFIALLTTLPEVRLAARAVLPWLTALPLVGVWSYWLDGLFIGMGWTARMRDVMAISVLGIFLPLWWLTRSLENHGLWLALSAFLGCRGALQLYMWLQFQSKQHWRP